MEELVALLYRIIKIENRVNFKACNSARRARPVS